MKRELRRTLFHGCLQPGATTKSKSLAERACWLILFLFTAGAAVFHIHLLFLHQQNDINNAAKSVEERRYWTVNPSAHKMQRFPDLLLCHKYWVSERRMIEQNFKRVDLDALARVFMIPPFFLDPGVATASNHTHFTNRVRRRQLDELVRSLSFGPKEIVKFVGLHLADGNASLSLRLTGSGPCIKIGVNVRLEPLMSHQSSVIFTVRKSMPAFGVKDWIDMDLLYVGGGAAESIWPANGYPVPPGMKLSAKVSSFTSKRFSRAESPCRENWSSGDQAACIQGFINQWCTDTGKLPFYMPKARQKIDDVSTYLLNMMAYEKCNFNAIKEISSAEKFAHCPPPCEKTFHEVTFAPLSNQISGDGVIIVSLADAFGSLQVEERVREPDPSTPLVVRVGQMGILVTLWTGASALSLMTSLLTPLFLLCRNRAKVRSDPAQLKRPPPPSPAAGDSNLSAGDSNLSVASSRAPSRLGGDEMTPNGHQAHNATTMRHGGHHGRAADRNGRKPNRNESRRPSLVSNAGSLAPAIP